MGKRACDRTEQGLRSVRLHEYMMKEGRQERERESKSPLKETERIPMHEDCLEMRPARRRDGWPLNHTWISGFCTRGQMYWTYIR